MEGIQPTQKEKLLYEFLNFLKEKNFIDDWTFEYEKEISCFLNNKILEKHCDLIFPDILEILGNDNEKACKVLNAILGKAE